MQDILREIVVIAKTIPTDCIRGTRGSVSRIESELNLIVTKGVHFQRVVSHGEHGYDVLKWYYDKSILLRSYYRVFWECQRLRTVMCRERHGIHEWYPGRAELTYEFWDNCVVYSTSVIRAIKNEDHAALSRLFLPLSYCLYENDIFAGQCVSGKRIRGIPTGPTIAVGGD